MQVMVAQKVAVGVYKGVTTSELDELAAETSASMTATHPDYALVSSPFMSSFPADPFVQTHADMYTLAMARDTSWALPVPLFTATCPPYADMTFYASSCAAACSKNCCLQPSQEHTEVIQ